MPSRRTAPLVRLLAFEALGLLVLGRTAAPLAARAPLAGAEFWARATTADLAAALLWWVAAVALAGLVATTALGAFARLVPGPAAARQVVDRLAPRMVRRALDRALVCTIAVGTVAAAQSSASATTASTTTTTAVAAPAAVVQVMPDGEIVVGPRGATALDRRPSHRPPAAPPRVSSLDAATRSAAASRTDAEPPPAAPRSVSHPSPKPPVGPAAPSRPSGPPPAPVAAHHTVVAGDNLWSIAAEHLEAGAGAPVGNAPVAAYWRRVVDANRATLRSGDPNVIFPGELVALPPA